jgi:hypothetical protein
VSNTRSLTPILRLSSDEAFNIVTHQGTNPGGKRCLMAAIAVLCLAFGAVSARAQSDPPKSTPPGTTSAPVVDSASGGPVAAPPAHAPATDSAAESSPIIGTPHGAALTPNQHRAVRLEKTIDSAHLHNGDMLTGELTAPARASDGRSLPAGTRVGVTVLAVTPVGKIASHGEITLQVTHVGSIGVLSDALTFSGKPGPKELPDSAPAKGTEATVSADTTLRFHVPPLSY